MPESTSTLSTYPKYVPSASVAGAGAPEQPGFAEPVEPVEPVGWGEGPVVSVGDDGSVTLGSPVGPGPAWVSSSPLSAIAASVPTTVTTTTIPATTIHVRRLLPRLGGSLGGRAGIGAVGSGGGAGGSVGSLDTRRLFYHRAR